MLVLAAPAVAEILAERSDTLGGGFKDLNQPSAAKTLFHFGQFDFHRFSQSHKRDENDEISGSSDAFAAKSDVVDGQRELRAN